jgi:flagellar protein FliL
VAKENEKTVNLDGSIKPSLMSRVIPILIISILAGGGGYIQGSLVRGNSAPEATKKEAGITSETLAATEASSTDHYIPENSVAAKTIVRPLAPIISNLGFPSETWMRLELSVLMTSGASSEQDIVAAKAGESVVTFLRTVDLKKIEGPSGFLHFREDLSDLLTTQFRGSVTGVLIGSMVVE